MRVRGLLASAQREHVTIINTEYGQPYTVGGFSQWMRDAITKAALPLDCQPHGLRKAAGRRLAEAGCSANEIMSVLDIRRSPKRSATRAKLIRHDSRPEPSRNWRATRGTDIAQTTSRGLGKNEKSRGESK
jgi:hypothetical protein